MVSEKFERSQFPDTTVKGLFSFVTSLKYTVGLGSRDRTMAKNLFYIFILVGSKSVSWDPPKWVKSNELYKEVPSTCGSWEGVLSPRRQPTEQ